jgi:hypothetical protein
MDKAAYQATARKRARLLRDNFRQYEDMVAQDFKAAIPIYLPGFK